MSRSLARGRVPVGQVRPMRQRGFSLIEVLIALVVLAVGLLGLALLQTMNLRYTQSAQSRTMAVNLGNELLDTMRGNRSMLQYYAMEEASFAGVTPTASTGCAVQGVLSVSNNITRWQCEVREALGADAYAVVDVAGAPDVSVRIVWTEANMPVIDDAGNVELRTTL